MARLEGLGRRLRRNIARTLSSSQLQGIRFRLGLAMAVALLPILLLGAVQTQDSFREQQANQRDDLRMAAERSAIAARSRIEGAVVLLQALSPESLDGYCEPRLDALLDRLDGYAGLYRLDAQGRIVCAARNAQGRLGGAETTGRSAWFERLRAGETMTVARSGDDADPVMTVAIRAQRPPGDFDGAMIAVIPLDRLRPDLSDRSLPEGAEAALTDAGGRLLTATAPGAFRLRGGATAEEELRRWISRLPRDGSVVFEATDRSGRRRVYSTAMVAGRDVHVLLSAPAPELLSWARLNPIGALLLPLAAWLTAFIAVMLVSERIVIRWLTYLERVAAIYARGRFSVRPVQALNAPSEFRILAHSLDEMAETISARDRSLLDSLDEKDALMREIHHRVKNNLQIISSLLSMQQRALADPAAQAAIGDTRQRISALALIYRTLYQSPDIRAADARDFLTELVGQLTVTTARGPMVITHVDADSLPLDPDKLPPLALWLVEAIGNAQKHALEGRGGRLTIRFRVEGDTSRLEVEDDGSGPPDRSEPGVGLTLMNAFARQLRGSAELVPGPKGGTIARMVFATPVAPRAPPAP